MRKAGSVVMRALITLMFTLAFLLVIWCPLVTYVHYVGLKDWKNYAVGWITGEEVRQLMRYHGADIIKITKEKAYIWRESRWIAVRHREEWWTVSAVPNLPETFLSPARAGAKLYPTGQRFDRLLAMLRNGDREQDDSRLTLH